MFSVLFIASGQTWELQQVFILDMHSAHCSENLTVCYLAMKQIIKIKLLSKIQSDEG